MKDLREAKIFRYKDQSRQECYLSQENYVIKMLEKFNMAEARSVTTPLTDHFRLSSSQCPNL